MQSAIPRQSAAPRLSVVVPVLNDDPSLRRLIDELERQASQIPIELVVVNAGEGLSVALDIEHLPAQEVHCTPGRGLQLNAGAARARGDILWFLHADATPPPDAAKQILRHVDAGHDGGWFRFRFEGVDSGGTRWLADCINWRARRGVAYGDQGLFFTRSHFEACGGFAEQPLFEEVALVKAARRRGRFTEIDAAIGVDPRRWIADGWVRRTLKNRALAIGHACGVSPARLADWYRRW